MLFKLKKEIGIEKGAIVRIPEATWEEIKGRSNIWGNHSSREVTNYSGFMVVEVVGNLLCVVPVESGSYGIMNIHHRIQRRKNPFLFVTKNSVRRAHSSLTSFYKDTWPEDNGQFEYAKKNIVRSYLKNYGVDISAL